MKATDLIKALQNKRIESSQLSSHQRKVIIKFFIEEQSDFSNNQIAELIGITNVHVSRLKHQSLKKAVWEIEDIDIKILAVSLKKRKEEYQRRAVKGNDISLAWKIEMDYIEKMQSLGFVYEAPKKFKGEFKTMLSMEDLKESVKNYADSNID